MKRNNFLFAAIFILFLANCKNEDNTVTSFIAGKWKIDTTVITTYQNHNGGFTMKSTDVSAYFNFFSSDQAFYRNFEVLDTTKYLLIGTDSILMDLNHDNILDAARIITVDANKKLQFIWTYNTYKQNNITYKTVAKINLVR